MNPETSAKNLIDSYLKLIKERLDVFNSYTDLLFSRDNALICVERIEELIYATPINDATFTYRKEQLEYWGQVKEIISSKQFINWYNKKVK